jgi:Cd2+/Zn2+-exporting ATPase
VLLAIAGVFACAAEVVAWRVGRDTHPAVVVLAILSLPATARQVLWRGLRAARKLSLDIAFLMSVAIAGACVLGNWPEAAMVSFLFALAETVEEGTADHVRHAIKGLLQAAPARATVRGDSGDWGEVDASEVGVGAVGLVKPGERIPFDGVVLSGASTVDQAPITGESVPVDKRPGDAVYAGTVNGDGAIEYRITADATHTTLARIVRVVEEAQAQRAPVQRFVDRFAAFYTPAVVLGALVVALAPPLVLGLPFAVWLYKALVLLVISCPCALVISTPATIAAGLAVAAKRGILVKGGVHLENARRLRIVALDKTGTLTVGRPVVTDVAPLNGVPPEAALRIAAGLSAMSHHPISRALRDAAPNSVPRVESFSALAGRGVTGVIDGHRYFLGNHRLTEENRVCGEHVERVLFALESEGKSTVTLTSESEPIAVIAVADTLRETGVEAVRRLHKLGVEAAMLTGDNRATAQAVAAIAGIDDVRAELLPEDKLAAVDELRVSHGTVAMVGDGINDAPALARADLGIAMGAAGTDVALETADVALMDDDLRKVPELIGLSRSTAVVLTQNISFAICVKVAFLALAIAGKATLWMAVFADMGASLLVVGNALRMLRHKGPRATGG